MRPVNGPAWWAERAAIGAAWPELELVQAQGGVRKTQQNHVEAYWSGFLGVPKSALRTPGIVVTSHAALRGYRGVWFFVRGRSGVVSAQSGWIVRLERSLGRAAAHELLSPDLAVRALGRAAGEIVGPSFQGWLPPDRFCPVAPEGVRRPPQSETESLRLFQSSCPREDWNHGGIDLTAADIWASFQENRIVALGQLRRRSRGAVAPGVITHPKHRGQGHASRLVSVMAQAALAQERLVLYQTLVSNGAAISIARRLGFAEYATLVAVRLARDAD